MTCPVERVVAEALTEAGIKWTYESNPERPIVEGEVRLDFELENGVFIEAKLMHTPRTDKQLAATANVILIQGMEAAEWFSKAITGKINASK